MLARCLFEMYRGFVTGSPQLSDLTFNRKVVDVMDEAKAFARIRRQGQVANGSRGNGPGSTLAPARGSGGRQVACFRHPNARPIGVPSIDLMEANQRRGD
jgi:hypothetical protein